jgi:hypothetical protein
MNKINRNDPCPCGSGKKYKKCCELKDQERRKKKFEGTRGLRINPLVQQNNPIRTLASHVITAVTTPIEAKRKKEESSSAETTATSPTEKPKSYRSLEELIGLESDSAK